MNGEVVPLLCSSSRQKTSGSGESPPFPATPPTVLRATLAFGGTSQCCGQPLAKWPGRLLSLPPSSPSPPACEGSPVKTLFAGDASPHRHQELLFSLMKDFPLQTFPGHLRCDAVLASAGAKCRWGCQLLMQPAVVLSINSFMPFNCRQCACVEVCLSHLHSYEDVRGFPIGFGWDAGLEASFCIPRSVSQERSADTSNLRANTICPDPGPPGFGKPCPEGMFSGFWSWPHDVVNCNHLL